MSTLEQRYRKVIRLLPKAYRADRSEEILGTLLDDARPGQKRPQLKEVASLGGLALRLRFGAPGASPGGELFGQVARRVILIGLLLACLENSFGPYLIVVDVVRLRALPSPAADLTLAEAGEWLLFSVLLLSVLRGWWRTSRVLSILGFLLLTAEQAAVVVQNMKFPGEIGIFAVLVFPTVSWLLNSITLLAVIPAFHREAPRVGGQRWWILIWALAGVLYGAHLAFVGPYTSLVLVAAAAVGLALVVKKAAASPVWPIALVVASWPLVLLAADAYAVAPFGAGTGATIMVLVVGGIDAFLLCTAFAFAAARRRRVPA